MKTLIVDDEQNARYGMRKALPVEGEVFEARNLQQARKTLHERALDLILLDLNLGEESGFDLLDEIQQQQSPPAVVIITAHGNEKIAVEAIKKGAFDYLSKPFDLDEFRLVCRNASRQRQLSQENQQLRAELAAISGYGELIGGGPAMQKVFSLLERVAGTDVTVLLCGESGTGKELVALEIHRRSNRKGEMVCVNCASIPENLIESELFGHEKGAFTGASDRRTGKFEQARGGTIFLDEIGDMPLETQAKILRVLENRTIERLGGNDSIDVDVRIVSATHRDLAEMVQKQRFREDLFYRLEVVTIVVPPLRQRKEDLLPLLNHFIDFFSRKHDRPPPTLTDRALGRLMDYPFPGNVRQLRNLVERLVVLQEEGEADVDQLPAEIRFFSEPGLSPRHRERAVEAFLKMDFKQAREAFEVLYLLSRLRQHDNNITHTAEAIGIHRQSLQQKIKDLNLRERMTR